MKCCIHHGEAWRVLTLDEGDVCERCLANLARIAITNRIHYQILLFETAAATCRQLEDANLLDEWQKRLIYFDGE